VLPLSCHYNYTLPLRAPALLALSVWHVQQLPLAIHGTIVVPGILAAAVALIMFRAILLLPELFRAVCRRW
jgi:hypothetical protein